MQAPTIGQAVVAKLRLVAKYGRTGPALRRGLAMLARGDFAGVWRKLFRALDGPDFEGREPHDEAGAYEAWRRGSRPERRRPRAPAAARRRPSPTRRCSRSSCTPPARKRTCAAPSNPCAGRRTPAGSCASPATPPVASTFGRTIVYGWSVSIKQTRDRRRGRWPRLHPGTRSRCWTRGTSWRNTPCRGWRGPSCEDRGLDMLYGDEDRLAPDGSHVEPFFKPDWSPDLSAIVDVHGSSGRVPDRSGARLGGFRPEFGAAQNTIWSCGSRPAPYALVTSRTFSTTGRRRAISAEAARDDPRSPGPHRSGGRR